MLWVCIAFISIDGHAQTALAPYESYDQESTVELVGFYTNEKSADGEHSSGYFLHLWSISGQLVGKLTVNEGLIGTGKAEWIEGTLTGQILAFESSMDNEQVTFIGTISDKKLAGVFKWSDQTAHQKQVLKRCCSDAPIHRNYPNLKSFMAQWAQLDAD